MTAAPGLDYANLRDKDVLRTLDSMATEGISAYLYGQPPRVVTTYATGQGNWRQGDGRPILADDDPAVMQAIGRCAAARVRWPEGLAARGPVHPEPCGWCGYPVAELLRACDWSVFMARPVTSEHYEWRGKDGSLYTRLVRSETYENPAHAAFWTLPTAEREARVMAAVEASRA